MAVLGSQAILRLGFSHILLPVVNRIVKEEDSVQRKLAKRFSGVSVSE